MFTRVHTKFKSICVNRILDDFSDFVDEKHITTAYDVKQGKPAPYPYLMGLQKAGGLRPWEAIVVENAPLGIRAGASARIFTVAVNTGPLESQVLLKAGANLLFERMTSFSLAWPELIKSLSL